MPHATRHNLPKVFELDLSNPDKLDLYDLGIWKEVVCDIGPPFIRRIDELDQKMSTGPPSLSLQTNTPPATKLQINMGGGSFPWHFDNPGHPTNAFSPVSNISVLIGKREMAGKLCSVHFYRPK